MRMLFVIHALNAGGAEKSLISLLGYLKEYNDIEIDLLVAWPTGMYMSQIPEGVNVIKPPKDFAMYATPVTDRLFPGGLCSKLRKCAWHIVHYIKKRKSKINEKELYWELFGKRLKRLPGEYDAAVSYMNGFPNYYVADKVNARKKILWVHNDYGKLNLNDDFERKYFKKADCVVTISEACAQSLRASFPEMKDKFKVLENISSESTIRKSADEFYPTEYGRTEKKWKLLSVGRLNEQKGFDIAIKAAVGLKEANADFCWYIIGEGSLKDCLMREIKEAGLDEGDFVLLGQRTNPYPYIKNCDIFVQPSRFEGKSIVLDEAKILCRPIVVTNYTTVADSVTDGVEGLIAEIDSQSICDRILELINNSELRNRLIGNLKSRIGGNESEIDRYYELFCGE